MNNFFVDQLIETRSVKRLDRFALKVICLVLFVGLFVCLFVRVFGIFCFSCFGFKCL